MKAFKVHKMYKGSMVKTAKTMAEHNKLKKMGYTHTKPKSMKKPMKGMKKMKAVPAKNKGLKKLPKKVRNKMGYK